MTPIAPPSLPTRLALRYVQPLREGGSLPAVVDTDDGLFVVKFRGAGQGPKALVAELLVGGIARALALPVPALAFVELPEGFGEDEPDPEIRDLLRASRGVNVGLRYLDGAFNYDARAAADLISPDLAAEIVWLDGFVTNPDRTAGNPNLLIWQRAPWLIDHGSALYVHHRWPADDAIVGDAAFPALRDHVLLERASDLRAADARIGARMPASLVGDVVATLPDALLGADADAERARYRRYLSARLAARTFVADAIAARDARAAAPRARRMARR